MIPLHLRISGFLSYRDTVELDFKSFDLACISGHNGAGKSSLLDAITWSLFGEARGKSSEVINLHPDVKAAEVALTFKHEENTYRVQRTLPRNKNTLLEFQVRTQNGWKPLTEKTTHVVFSLSGFHPVCVRTWNSSIVFLLRGNVRCTR